MAGRSAILSIRIISDASNAAKGFDDTGRRVDTFADKVTRAGRTGAVALAGLAGAGLVAVKAGEAVATSQARTANVLDSMGYPEATARVNAYADALESQVAVDETTIRATQAKLATFDELAKTADTVGGSFDRATLAALDLAAAGFGEAESNAVQLGKALNDPAKGLSALTRSGITFTAAEQDKIKALQESGDMLAAQEILLAAIEKQVGGTAAATADTTDRLALSWGNVTEAVGVGLLPMLDSVAPRLEGLAGFIERNSTAVIAFAGGLAAVAGIAVAASAALKAYTVATQVLAAATKALRIAQIALTAAWMLSPIGLIVGLVIALGAALVLAYKKSATFRAFVQRAFDVVRKAVATVVEWVGPKLSAAFRVVQAAARVVFAALKAYVTVYIRVITAVVRFITTGFRNAWDAVKRGASALSSAVSGAMNRLLAPIKRVASFIRDTLAGAWRVMRDAATSAVNAILTPIRAVRDAVESLLSKLRSIKLPSLPRLPWQQSAGAAGAYTVPVVPYGRAAATAAAPASAGPTINVYGAVDPDATARQIRRLLAGHDRRTGRAALDAHARTVLA